MFRGLSGLRGRLEEKVDLAGDAMTGYPLILARDPVESAEAATKAYVDAAVGEVLLEMGIQPADETLTALALLDATPGLVEQTGSDTFAKRPLGVATAESIPTLGDGDLRWGPAANGYFAGAPGMAIPAERNLIELAGYSATSQPIAMPFVRVGAAEPPDSLKFQDDGTDWWKLVAPLHDAQGSWLYAGRRHRAGATARHRSLPDLGALSHAGAGGS